MRKEFNFGFSELVTDHQLIRSLLGYENTPLPDPFNRYLDEALTEAHSFTDIRATYLVV